MKTYTFQTQNVYVSGRKRIRIVARPNTCHLSQHSVLLQKGEGLGAELFHFYDRDPCASEANILITEVLDTSYSAQIRAD